MGSLPTGRRPATGQPAREPSAECHSSPCAEPFSLLPTHRPEQLGTVYDLGFQCCTGAPGGEEDGCWSPWLLACLLRRRVGGVPPRPSDPFTQTVGPKGSSCGRRGTVLDGGDSRAPGSLRRVPSAPPPRSCHLVPASHVCSACSVLGGPGAEVVGGRVWGLVQSRITPRSWLQLWGCHWNRDRPGMCSPSLGAGPEWATWALSGMIRDIQGCASLPTPATHYRHPVSSALDIFFIFITALVAGTRG